MYPKLAWVVVKGVNYGGKKRTNKKKRKIGDCILQEESEICFENEDKQRKRDVPSNLEIIESQRTGTKKALKYEFMQVPETFQKWLDLSRYYFHQNF